MLIKHIIVVLVTVWCYVMGDYNTRSLTFVIDDTISMYDEIDQVKQKTHEIFNAVHNSNESQIDEFIIVTFNDFSKYNVRYKQNKPHAKLLVIAKDEAEFKKALYSIKVGGGDDCPEMAMAGIEMALKHSKTNSYLYIFTDAAAKDYENFEYIKSLSQRKMIQVTFLLTGKCKTAPIESYVVYDKLATATSGQVFHIDKQDVEKIIEYVIANIQSKRTILARKTFKRGCENEFKFTVDSKVWYVLISVSAENPVFRHVIGPDGAEAKIEEFVHTNHTYIVKLKGDPGEYTIDITSCDETSIVVTASTSVSFTYGFSPTKTSNLDETSTKPLPDKQSYLAIDLDNIENDVTLEMVELRDIDDNLIKELPLKLINEDKQFYISELFDPPKMIFKIAIIGYTKIREKIIRVSQTTLEYYKPADEERKDIISPTVTILAKDEVIAEYDKPVTLKCKVNAFPEPKITWEDELHTILPSTVSMVDPPYVYISTLHIAKITENATFTCKAKNDNEDSDSIKITIKQTSFIKVLDYPTDVTVELDKSVQFNFKIDSLPPSTVIWYKINKTIVNNDDFEISSDSSVLKIKNVQPRLEGIYFVEASNGDENKKYEFKVTVSGTEKPVINKNITIYTKTLESQVDLTCRVIQGKPKPEISWEFDYNTTGEFVKLSDTNEIFHIDRIELNNAGTYRCNAINEVGMDYHDMQLVVERKISEISPLVTILKKDEVVAVYDEPITLECKVKAYPKPNVTWEDKLHNVWPSTVTLTDSPYIYVSTLQVEKVIKNSTFTCKANNDDEYSDSIQIIPLIKTFLEVLEYPTDVTVESGKSVEFNYKTNATPQATIIWYQNNNTIKNNDDFEIRSDGSILKIKNIQPRLGGRYIAEASNAFETHKYEFTVTLVGTEKPMIDKNNTIYTKDLKSNVDLICSVIRGKPKPLITWEFDYNYSGKFIKLENTNEILHINNLKVNNIGKYRCNAVNEIGTDFHDMQLFIEHSPTVKIKPIFYKALEGEQVKLDCIVEGLPVPMVKWLKKDKEIKYGSKYKIFRNNSLSFAGTREDSDNYICEATNYLDSARKSVDVVIYEPVKIEIPIQSIFNATLHKSLTLPCRASGYPKPALNWFYYSFEYKEPKLLKYSVNKSLEMKYIQAENEGLYKCIASNEIDYDDITYEVYVPVGAWIIRVLNTKLEVVLGDPKIELKCTAFGSPKPTVTWTINESTIESDSGLYKVETNGKLILTNITMKSKGTYTCKAENPLASDKIEYEVNVHTYPPIPEEPPQVVVLLIEGTTNPMLCGMPLNDEDFVRWFKDGKLLKTGELTLINVTKLDDGFYTCRVNTAEQSFSFHKRVIVGIKPKFTNMASPTIIFIEGALATLNCSASGEPPPTTKWIMDDRTIPVTSESYEFVMKKNNINLYKCLVSNEFGTINRNFDITGGECLLNFENDMTALQPMLLTNSRKRSWPLFERIDGSFKVPKYRKYQIFCPESFISYAGENYGLSASISCLDGSVFQLGDKNASFSEIVCQKPIIPLAIKRNNDTCSGPTRQFILIGFEINNSFRPVYAICFDSDMKIAVFAMHSIHPGFADMVPKHVGGYFQSTHINLQLDDVYDCRNQLDLISAFTGEILKKDDTCCFSRRQLVNPKDVLPGISQIATYHYLNVVPQWSTCGAENWDEVERRVRSYTLDINKEIYLWTGTSNGNTRVGHDIYLKDVRNQQLQVPKFIWKVIEKQIAIIHINIPNLKTSETTDYILCKDICNTVEWMKSTEWHDVDKGFIYCCDIKEFEMAFDYKTS